jgi:hypothetical protein
MGGTRAGPEPARPQDNMEGCDLKLTAAKIILYYLSNRRFHGMKCSSEFSPAGESARVAIVARPRSVSRRFVLPSYMGFEIDADDRPKSSPIHTDFLRGRGDQMTAPE